MGFLKSRRKPTNLQYRYITDTFRPIASQLAAQGSQGLGAYMNALTGEDGGAGFDNFKRSIGYQNIFGEAMRGVSGSAAARGLLQSGSTLRGLQTRAGQLAQGAYQNYLGNLLQGSQVGLQGGLGAGQLIADVGSQNRKTGGLTGFLGALGQIGQVAGGLATLSDPRAKDNIELIDTKPDGLGVYRFTYRGDDREHIGVLANEVAVLRPEALGPLENGFLTVDYSRLDVSRA